MLNQMKGAIFDLDGVIVDTAKYHYLAWKRLAEEFDINFTEAHNERLKGVSRTRSLDILLELTTLQFTDKQKEEMADRKNKWYIEYITKIDDTEILPGVKKYILTLREKGIKIALGSASKNSQLILEKLGIVGLFDAIIDGNKVKKAKPDPEVFLLAAMELGLMPSECIVFEDAVAGVQAAKSAGMKVIGIGSENILDADIVIKNLAELL